MFILQKYFCIGKYIYLTVICAKIAFNPPAGRAELPRALSNELVTFE